MTQRKGARSRATIDLKVLDKLNSGTLESASLSEVLAVDFELLVGHVVADLTPEQQQRVANVRKQGITKRMDLVATVLAEHLDRDAAGFLKSHESDTVRGWAAFVIGKDRHLSLAEKLSAVYPLANDPHFCVREWAWLALRPAISADIRAAMAELESWAASDCKNIRRFAIEATRPRGVWSKHITELKESPHIGTVLLNHVMLDSSRYVQDSCGNWLNDAAKSKPLWVMDFCNEWTSKSTSPATHYIAKRGLRNITKPE